MMKTTIFKALALGLLSHALISGPADAQGAAGCPAFNASMVDAAMMATNISPGGEFLDETSNAADNPWEPSISCFIRTDSFTDTFSVFVGADQTEEGNVVFVEGTSVNAGDTTLLRTLSGGPITEAQLHACRAQVLQSFVWNQHCIPLLD